MGSFRPRDSYSLLNVSKECVKHEHFTLEIIIVEVFFIKFCSFHYSNNAISVYWQYVCTAFCSYGPCLFFGGCSVKCNAELQQLYVHVMYSCTYYITKILIYCIPFVKKRFFSSTYLLDCLYLFKIFIFLDIRFVVGQDHAKWLLWIFIFAFYLLKMVGWYLLIQSMFKVHSYIVLQSCNSFTLYWLLQIK